MLNITHIELKRCIEDSKPDLIFYQKAKKSEDLELRYRVMEVDSLLGTITSALHDKAYIKELKAANKRVVRLKTWDDMVELYKYFTSDRAFKDLDIEEKENADEVE